MFEDAVNRDPGFAVAHAGLADIFSRLPIATDGPYANAIARAKASAARAIAIDPNLPEAHGALGWIAFYGDWDCAESERRFTRALQLNPREFSSNVGVAHLHSNTGRSAEALRAIEQAMALEPTSPLAGTLRAEFLYHARRYDDARDQLRKTLAAAPGFWIARQYLGQLHLVAGNLGDALGEFESARRSGGSYAPLAAIGYTHALAGRRAEAIADLRALMDASKTSYVPPYYFALVHLGLDDHPQTLEWLERAYAEKDVRMVFIGVDPLWDRLRKVPRFAALLQKMKLGQSARSTIHGVESRHVTNDVRVWVSDRLVRDRRSAGGRRYGRGVSGTGHQIAPRGRVEDLAGHLRRRSRTSRAFRA